MSICSDSWIKKMSLEKKMIQPFVDHQVRHFDPEYQDAQPLISYGLSSYGYDIRVSNQFKVFTNLFNTVVDPKAFDHRSFVDIETDICVIPPNSFALAESMEYFIIPRDVLTLCVGKSTYARCFSGDTKVALVDGSCPTFKDLVDRYNQGERTFLGYGFYGHEYVTQYITEPRMIGFEDTIIIELNHGECIECTPDHEFISSNGAFIAAEKLNIGDSLLPLCLNRQNGYEMIYNPVTGKWKNTEITLSEYDSITTHLGAKNLYSSQSIENHRTTNYQEINPNSKHISHKFCDQCQVIKIINGNKTVPVYCLTAQTGNFGLCSGVMVSNCGIIINVTPFEPEWQGYVTLEISNTTPLPVKIYSNEGIAQVIFFQSQDICEVSYADRAGKYMKQSGVTGPKI